MAEILDHDFDGIQEFDNPIPTWLASLFGLLEGMHEWVQMGQIVARSLVGEWLPCNHDLPVGTRPSPFLLARALR